MNTHLTAAEAAILLQPNARIGGKVLKLFLLELTARGALSVRREGWLKKGFVAFALDGETKLPDAPFARPAWAALGGTQFAGSEVPISDVVDLAREAYGTDYKEFQAVVERELVEKRLIEEQPRTILKVFHTVTNVLTPLGEETRRNIERELATMDASWSRRKVDTADLATAVRTLGPMVLLWPKFRRKHNEIDVALSQNQGANGSNGGWVYMHSSGDGSALIGRPRSTGATSAMRWERSIAMSEATAAVMVVAAAAETNRATSTRLYRLP